jgi:hypothetical protein
LPHQGEEIMAEKTKPNIIPEEISKTTGTTNVTHNAANVGGRSSAHIPAGGDSISGRHSERGAQLQSDQVAERQEALQSHSRK